MKRRQQQISAKKVVIADYDPNFYDPNFDPKLETLPGTVLDG